MIKFAASALLLVSAYAGAQTVTLGTTTSTVNGNTTTITLPVSVAVPPATTVAPAVMNSLRVKAAFGATNQTIGASFKTVALPSVVTDTASGWNAAANTYTVPVSGTYLIVSTVRFADGIAPGVSYGQGVHTSNVDNPTFLWSTTNGLRNGSTNMRIMQLSAGQTVNLFSYVDSSTSLSVANASLAIQQLQ